ncbi:MAG: HAMP domain-containing histidine kinase [Ruminococcus sp.]|nr:HAMP domain-containing histidine kinase [Ruminococcus sp.]
MFSLLLMLTVVVFLGVAVVSMSSEIYKRSLYKDIKSMGGLFISCVEDEYSVTGSLESDDVKRIHRNFMRTNKLKVYVYGEDGTCIHSGAGEGREPRPLSDTIRKAVDEDGEYLSLDSSSLSKSEPYIIYGTDFTITDWQQEKQDIYVVIYGRTDSIGSFTTTVMIAYIAAAALLLMIGGFAMMRRIKRLIRYEEHFQKVAEKYAKGDFSEKIDASAPDANKDIAEYVNTIAENVAKSDERSKTFVANVSHELRTPMTTIGGFVDGILDGTIPKVRQNEYLVLISQEIKRLRILISSMLNMTRFESGTMRPNFTETNLTDLVIQTVLMFEKRIEEKNLDVVGLDSGRISAVVDADLMQQVIYNLVENAVKFVNVNGTLSFRFEHDDGWYVIGIKNTGEGLKNDEIQQVFDRFYKTDSSRGKDTTGLGLGLSISRKIVHLHDGHIVVKSVYGEYTEFLIQIPDKRDEQSKG